MTNVQYTFAQDSHIILLLSPYDNKPRLAVNYGQVQAMGQPMAWLCYFMAHFGVGVGIRDFPCVWVQFLSAHLSPVGFFADDIPK